MDKSTQTEAYSIDPFLYSGIRDFTDSEDEEEQYVQKNDEDNSCEEQDMDYEEEEEDYEKTSGHESCFLNEECGACTRTSLTCDYCHAEEDITCYAVCPSSTCNLHVCILHCNGQPYCRHF